MSSVKSVKKIHKTLSLRCKLFLVLLVCLRRLTAAEKKEREKKSKGVNKKNKENYDAVCQGRQWRNAL